MLAPAITRLAADHGRGLRARALGPVDVASLAAFRIVFGLVMFVGIVRFLGSGWIQPMYGQPRFFFESETAPPQARVIPLVPQLVA